MMLMMKVTIVSRRLKKDLLQYIVLCWTGRMAAENIDTIRRIATITPKEDLHGFLCHEIPEGTAWSRTNNMEQNADVFLRICHDDTAVSVCFISEILKSL